MTVVSPLSVNPYLPLIRAFAREEMTARAFESCFLALRNRDIAIGDSVFDRHYDVLGALFYAVDDYCADEALRSEGDIDAEQLRGAAVRALDALEPNEERRRSA